MEDLIGVIVLIIYFVIAANTKKKKAAKKKNSRMPQGAFEQELNEADAMASQRMDRRQERRRTNRAAARQEHAAARQERPAAAQMASTTEHRLQREPLRTSGMQVITPSQAQMHAAGEGVDPCHIVEDEGVRNAADAGTEASPVYRSPIFSADDPQQFSRDVLRGVVMSEILTRPKDRPARIRMKRGA